MIQAYFPNNTFSIHAAWEGGATSLTSASGRLQHTQHAARGAGVPVADLIVPYGIFLCLSALIPEIAKGVPADTSTPKSCECKGEPLVSVSTAAVLLGWMTVEDPELHKANKMGRG